MVPAEHSLKIIQDIFIKINQVTMTIKNNDIEMHPTQLLLLKDLFIRTLTNQYQKMINEMIQLINTTAHIIAQLK